MPLPDDVAEVAVDAAPGWSTEPAPPVAPAGITPDDVIGHLEGGELLGDPPAQPAVPRPGRAFTPPPLPEPTGLDPLEAKRTNTPVPSAWGGAAKAEPLAPRSESGERLDGRSVRSMSTRVEGNIVRGRKSSHSLAIGAAVLMSASALLVGAWSASFSDGSTGSLLAYSDDTEIGETEIDASAAWAADNQDAFVAVQLNGCGGNLSVPGVAVGARTVIVVASAVETDATPSVLDRAGTEHLGSTIAVDEIQDLAVIRLETEVPSWLTWGGAQGIDPGAIVTVAVPSIDDVVATPTEVIDIAQRGSTFEGLELDAEWAHGSVVIGGDGLIAGIVQRNGTTATSANDISRFVSSSVLAPGRITRTCPAPPTTLADPDSTDDDPSATSGDDGDVGNP